MTGLEEFFPRRFRYAQSVNYTTARINYGLLAKLISIRCDVTAWTTSASTSGGDHGDRGRLEATAVGDEVGCVDVTVVQGMQHASGAVALSLGSQ